MCEICGECASQLASIECLVVLNQINLILDACWSSFIIIDHYYITEIGDLAMDLMIDMKRAIDFKLATNNTIGAVCLANKLHVLC